MNAMKKIAIFQRDFQVGGIQKALLNILQNLDYSRYAVDVYYFEAECFYQLPRHENLRYILLKPYPYWTRLVYFDLLRSLTRFPVEDRDYDLAIDFNSYSSECAVGALSVRAKKRIMWIHNDVEIKLRDEKKYRVLWHFFKGKFKDFDAFAAVSPGIIPGFRKMTSLGSAPIAAIPNYIDTEEIFRKAAEPADLTVDASQYNLCSMGRLVHQKGFDILLDIMAEVCRGREDIHLTLIGDGPERSSLEEQVQRLGLAERVTMTGSLKNPFPLLKQMDGFALTSRYEGQGIVLWEAKALGLELFMAKHLEQYNPGLTGCEDMAGALAQAQKREKRPDDLREYNAEITKALEKLLNS